MNNLLLAKLAVLTNSPGYAGDCLRSVHVGNCGNPGGCEQMLVDDVGIEGGSNNGHEDKELDVDETDELVG